MRNPNSFVGIIRDTAGLGVKVSKVGFKALSWTIGTAHNVVDFAVEATKEGYAEGRGKTSEPVEPVQMELDFTNEHRNQNG